MSYANDENCEKKSAEGVKQVNEKKKRINTIGKKEKKHVLVNIISQKQR